MRGRRRGVHARGNGRWRGEERRGECAQDAGGAATIQFSVAGRSRHRFRRWSWRAGGGESRLPLMEWTRQARSACVCACRVLSRCTSPWPINASRFNPANSVQTRHTSAPCRLLLQTDIYWTLTSPPYASAAAADGIPAQVDPPPARSSSRSILPARRQRPPVLPPVHCIPFQSLPTPSRCEPHDGRAPPAPTQSHD